MGCFWIVLPCKFFFMQPELNFLSHVGITEHSEEATHASGSLKKASLSFTPCYLWFTCALPWWWRYRRYWILWSSQPSPRNHMGVQKGWLEDHGLRSKAKPYSRYDCKHPSKSRGHWFGQHMAWWIYEGCSCCGRKCANHRWKKA